MLFQTNIARLFSEGSGGIDGAVDPRFNKFTCEKEHVDAVKKRETVLCIPSHTASVEQGSYIKDKPLCLL